LPEPEAHSNCGVRRWSWNRTGSTTPGWSENFEGHSLASIPLPSPPVLGGRRKQGRGMMGRGISEKRAATGHSTARGESESLNALNPWASPNPWEEHRLPVTIWGPVRWQNDGWQNDVMPLPISAGSQESDWPRKGAESGSIHPTAKNAKSTKRIAGWHTPVFAVLCALCTAILKSFVFLQRFPTAKRWSPANQRHWQRHPGKGIEPIILPRQSSPIPLPRFLCHAPSNPVLVAALPR